MMLEKILKVTGTQPLSKYEQKNIYGAVSGSGCCSNPGGWCEGGGICTGEPCSLTGGLKRCLLEKPKTQFL